MFDNQVLTFNCVMKLSKKSLLNNKNYITDIFFTIKYNLNTNTNANTNLRMININQYLVN